jgi:Acyclic terpene utilisation family protein AtuA
MADKIVRIGGASGAWGDSPMAIPQLLGADVQYLMMDYLAEVTMSLLARAKLKDPAAGFPPDFITYLKRPLPEIARRGIKVISNAGGVNPQACKRALEALCAELGIALRVAVVEGDDLMPRLDELRGQVREAVSGEPLPARLLTANAYLGALPIVAALAAGADIVVTGRCADSALALGILMHEFGWKPDDYDRLAAGSLVGHILECGPQSTGGTFTDWEEVPDWHNIGYPIAECAVDGGFVLSKPEGTGGLVVPGTVAEQVLYEVGDPAAYILPDVVADFSHVTVKQVGPNRVNLAGAKGRPPTAQYKVSATFQDGYRAVASISIVGRDAARKAERTAQALLERARMLFRQQNRADFSATHVEALGAEASYGSGSRARDTREVLLRLVVEHQDRDALEIFARELGSVGISFAPGTTGIYSGRPKPTPVVRLFTFFVDKSWLPPPVVQVGDCARFDVVVPVEGGFVDRQPVEAPEVTVLTDATVEVDLLSLAYARSGDKGDSSNIAIIARKPEYVPILRRELTPERIARHFAESVHGQVVRFEAPGLHAFNFLLFDALGGGGMASRRIDPQGKAYGQRALEMRIPVPKSVADALPENHRNHKNS